MTHYFVMTSSFASKILKIDKFGDIDYDSMVDDLEMVSLLYLINVTPGAHKVSASRAVQASEARLYCNILWTCAIHQIRLNRTRGDMLLNF